MVAVVTGLLAGQIISSVFTNTSLLWCVFVFVLIFACLVFASLLYFVFGFCTMSGVCDGCSGDWVIGLSNHINEGAQEGNAPELGIYGASLSLLSNVASSFPSLSSEMCSAKHFGLSSWSNSSSLFIVVLCLGCFAMHDARHVGLGFDNDPVHYQCRHHPRCCRLCKSPP